MYPRAKLLIPEAVGSAQKIGESAEDCHILVSRVRCVLSVSIVHADSFLNRCSDLFRHALAGLLTDVVSRLFPGRNVTIDVDQMVLDLGVLHSARFESEMIDRLARELAREIGSLAVFEEDASVSGDRAGVFHGVPFRSDGMQRLRANLQAGRALNDEVLDTWVTRQLRTSPATLLPALAGCCTEAQMCEQLVASLRPSTRAALIKRLTRGLPIAEPASNVGPQAFYLAAILYFLHNPNETMPGDRSRSTIPFVEPDEYESRLLELLSRDEVIQRASSTLKKHLQAIRHGKLVAPTAKHRASSDNDVALTADVLSVDGCGIVLLWPLLPDLFTRLGFWSKDRFVDELSAASASSLLGFLTLGCEARDKAQAALNNVLCGLPPEIEPIQFSPAEEQREWLMRWLGDLPTKLQPWRRLTAEDIRALFLCRPGLLYGVKSRTSLKLEVEPHASDVLLSPWPWPIDTVLLPWMKEPLAVRWER